MPCYSPLRNVGFEKNPTSNGRYKLSFTPQKHNKEFCPITIPCGKCIGCRIDKSINWAVRMTKEAELHKNNCFITLTYSNENLPLHKTLVKRDVQLFVKKLRKKTGQKILYYAVGEYGDQTHRPHYHACIFGFDFKDIDKSKPLRNHDSKTTCYPSQILTSLWPHGHSSVGTFNFKTAAYCARYVTKKIYGEKAATHYGDRIPEFALMSLKPAIGLRWLEQNLREVEDGKISINNKIVSMPRYYKNKLNKINPPYHVDNLISQNLLLNTDAKQAERAPARLQVLKTIFLEKAKHALLKRKI